MVGAAAGRRRTRSPPSVFQTLTVSAKSINGELRGGIGYVDAVAGTVAMARQIFVGYRNVCGHAHRAHTKCDQNMVQTTERERSTKYVQ